MANGTFDKRNIYSGILFGLGLAAFVDEAVFHQMLHWHHFYDKSTTNIGLLSDGLFHAFSWFATIGSLFMFADIKRRGLFNFRRWQGGVFLGSGGFQLYDGTIQHKFMKIHQIRYNVDIMPYDIIWNGIAFLLLAAGVILVFPTKNRSLGGSTVRGNRT